VGNLSQIAIGLEPAQRAHSFVGLHIVRQQNLVEGTPDRRQGARVLYRRIFIAAVGFGDDRRIFGLFRRRHGLLGLFGRGRIGLRYRRRFLGFLGRRGFVLGFLCGRRRIALGHNRRLRRFLGLFVFLRSRRFGFGNGRLLGLFLRRRFRRRFLRFGLCDDG